jgi:signal transduction histidine kinase
MEEDKIKTVQELLLIREARGLQVPVVFRLLFVSFGVVSAFMAPIPMGTRLKTLAFSVLIMAACVYFLVLLRKVKKVRFVGVTGVVIDSLSILAYPFVIYQFIDIPSAPLAVVSLSPAVLAVCLIYIVIASLALRPAYTIAVTSAAIVMHVGVIILSLNHPSVTWSVDTPIIPSISVVSLQDPVAWMIFLLIAGSALTWLTRSVRRTVIQAAELEAERTHLVREQANLLMDSRLGVMGELVAGVSHEMNNPLSVVKAGAETGRRAVGKIRDILQGKPGTTGLGEKADKILDALEQSSRSTLEATARMDTTLKTLRSFARMDEAEFKDVDVHDALENTLALILPNTIGIARVEKQYGELSRIQAYAGRLNQMFMTLLTRAFDSIKGEGAVTIATEAGAKDVSVRISDTGAAIPPDQLEHMFDIRLQTRESRIEAGFGMTACQSIIGQHIGRLQVESSAGKGTTFTITLPHRG